MLLKKLRDEACLLDAALPVGPEYLPEEPALVYEEFRYPAAYWFHEYQPRHLSVNY